MKRGDIWTVAGGKEYAAKPRPAVIVQDDRFDGTDSVTICAFTTNDTEAPLFRIPIAPNERNGLRTASRLMVDKITTVPKSKLGACVGRLDDVDIVRLNGAVLVFSDWRTVRKENSKREPRLRTRTDVRCIARREHIRSVVLRSIAAARIRIERRAVAHPVH